MIKQNMHIHSKYSWDCEKYGKMEIEEIAKILAQHDIKYGAITDHVEFDREELSDVIEKIKIRNLEIDKINEIYQGKVILLKGVEISEPQSYKKEVSTIADLDLDLIMGSIHKIDRHATTQIGIENAYKEYYEKVLKMIEANQIDVVGHLDYINRYYKEDATTFNQVMEIVEAMQEYDLIPELNTSAKRRCNMEIFPNYDKLVLYRAKNSKVTIGTDAHKYSELADNLETAEKLTEELQLRPVIYQKRKRIII